MPIPERLKLQPVDTELIEVMSRLCDEIAHELEYGRTAETLLQEWHSHARRRCDSYDFQHYWASRSKESFVLDAINPEPYFDEDVVYAEAIAVLGAVTGAEVPEAEINYYLGWLDAQFPRANIEDIIYYPDKWFGDASLFRDANGDFKPEAELSDEQILAYVMEKSGRKLIGAPTDVALQFRMPGECR